MKELLRTTNVMAISLLRQALAEEGIETLLLDEHSGGMFGGAGGTGPRLMVLDEDEYDLALRLARELGIVE